MAKCPNCDELHPDILTLLRERRDVLTDLRADLGLTLTPAQIAENDADALQVNETCATYEIELPLTHDQIASAGVFNLLLAASLVRALEEGTPEALIRTVDLLDNFLDAQLHLADELEGVDG